jgi:hypothetical protein
LTTYGAGAFIVSTEGSAKLCGCLAGYFLWGREMRHENVWELYESGDLPAIVEAFEDYESLNMIHSAMFENALDLGVTKAVLSRKMEDVNYNLARKHRLNGYDMAFFTRKSMLNYDYGIAIDVMRTQIGAIVGLIDDFVAKQKAEESGSTS